MEKSAGRSPSLDYIQAMLRELRTIAYGERHEILAYMIEMAYIECSDIIRGQRPRGIEALPEDEDGLQRRKAV